MNLPFYVSGDARLEVSKTEIYICKECGHLEFFNRYYIEKLNQEEQRNKEINEEKHKILLELDRLDKIPFDESYFLGKIKELKDEIATLERLGEGGKSIRSRIDSIKDYEKIIKEKKDPRIESQKNNLKNRLYELNNPHKNIY